nr:LysM peptidoglycan-binding domain-containing protein [Anaerolineae bacterium]
MGINSPLLTTQKNNRLLAGLISIGLVLIIVAGAMTGCGSEPSETPAAITATRMPTMTQSPTATLFVATDTPAPPVPTATLEPYQWVVSEGETLYYILQQVGYFTLDIVPEILALNGMVDENDLHPYQVLSIPRQTPTPGAPPPTIDGSGETVTTPDGDYQSCSPENRCLSPDGQYWMHEVVEGDTCSGLAFQYTTVVGDIIRDNGLTDSCFISPGDILKIYIRVTLTPTLTPTGGPDSTATPTPTLMPPTLFAPANGASIAAEDSVVLQWAATQPLGAGLYYLVVLRNVETGDEYEYVTRSNALRVPQDVQGAAGQVTRFEWWVVIVAGDTTGSPVISGDGGIFQFNWGP